MPDTTHIPAQIADLILSGRRVEAIKRLREESGYNLKLC